MVTAGEEAGPGWRTQRCHMKIVVAEAGCCQRIDRGCVDLGSEAAKVRPSSVVQDDHDDVGLVREADRWLRPPRPGIGKGGPDDSLERMWVCHNNQLSVEVMVLARTETLLEVRQMGQPRAGRATPSRQLENGPRRVELFCSAWAIHGPKPLPITVAAWKSMGTYAKRTFGSRSQHRSHGAGHRSRKRRRFRSDRHPAFHSLDVHPVPHSLCMGVMDRDRSHAR